MLIYYNEKLPTHIYQVIVSVLPMDGMIYINTF